MTRPIRALTICGLLLALNSCADLSALEDMARDLVDGLGKEVVIYPTESGVIVARRPWLIRDGDFEITTFSDIGDFCRHPSQGITFALIVCDEPAQPAVIEIVRGMFAGLDESRLVLHARCVVTDERDVEKIKSGLKSGDLLIRDRHSQSTSALTVKNYNDKDVKELYDKKGAPDLLSVLVRAEQHAILADSSQDSNPHWVPNEAIRNGIQNALQTVNVRTVYFSPEANDPQARIAAQAAAADLCVTGSHGVAISWNEKQAESEVSNGMKLQ
jgi:hypothetical protein